MDKEFRVGGGVYCASVCKCMHVKVQVHTPERRVYIRTCVFAYRCIIKFYIFHKLQTIYCTHV